MRVTTLISWDMETGEVLAWEGYDYAGPVDLAKGSGYAKTNMNLANNLSTALAGAGTGINENLTPFLQSEIENPIGFGQQAVTQMKTEGGQTAAGAQGSAQERARLAAARTGNLAALPSEQDKLARSATQSADQNALGIDIANTNAKLAQQQAGASGLGALGAEDIDSSLNALGLSNQALNQYMQAANWWQPVLGDVIQGGAKAGAAYLGA